MFDLVGFSADFLSRWTAHDYRSWGSCPKLLSAILPSFLRCVLLRASILSRGFLFVSALHCLR